MPDATAHGHALPARLSSHIHDGDRFTHGLHRQQTDQAADLGYGASPPPAGLLPAPAVVPLSDARPRLASPPCYRRFLSGASRKGATWGCRCPARKSLRRAHTPLTGLRRRDKSRSAPLRARTTEGQLARFWSTISPGEYPLTSPWGERAKRVPRCRSGSRPQLFGPKMHVPSRG